MGLGWTEIILIGVVLLFLFGPSRLPSMGKSLGEAIRGFKKGLDTTEDEIEKPVSRVAQPHQDQLSNSSAENQESKTETTKTKSE